MGKYQRKSKRSLYSKEKLSEAVREVECGRLSGYGASKKYEIPRMTIMDHVNKKRVKSTTLGRNTALSSEIEHKLATSLHIMEKYGFGLSRKEVLQMVGDYVTQNNLATSFKNGVPGKDWFVAFKNRHGLSVKKPQAVEYARKCAVDPFIVFPYFDLLEKTVNDLNLKDNPAAIWNLDETNFSKDPAKTKVVGAKGHAATRVISSPGRDNTTVLLGVNAAGGKLPPLIIFKGKNVWDTWTSPEAYPGTSYGATKNGWIETELFESFFKKTFLPAVQGQRPVLLIYDGHSTHVGLNIIEEARKENITILKLPPHTSHILQPLDIAAMKSFKDHWDPLLVKWQRLNVGCALPKSEFSRLIGQVWSELDPQVLRNGFKKAGIFPVNREVIKESQFDILKLRHWKELENRKHLNTRKEETCIERNPKSLLTIVLSYFKKNLIHEDEDEVILKEPENCKEDILIPKDPEISKELNRNKEQIVIRHDLDFLKENQNCNEPLENPTQEESVTFEELLLQKVKHGDKSAKSRRRKVAPGAEVITHTEVLERKRKEQNKNIKAHVINQNKAKDTGTKDKDVLPPLSSFEDKNDVVYLSDRVKSDSQSRPFVAQEIGNLPSCFKRRIPDSKKIKVISNILINQPLKQFDTQKENKDFNKKNQKVLQNAKLEEIDIGRNILKNPKPGPSGLTKVGFRRRSTASVSLQGEKTKKTTSEDETEESSSNYSLRDSSDEGPFVSESEASTSNEETEQHNIINCKKISSEFQIDQFLLVKLEGQKTNKFYVGKVLELIKGSGMTVKFMRRKGDQFYWPNVSDIGFILYTDVELVLMNPLEGRRGTFKFENIDFSKYNVQ